MLTKLKILSTLIVLLLVLLLSVPVFLINLIVRTAVWGLAKVFRPDLESFLMGQGSLFATHGTSKPTVNIIFALFVKGPMPVDICQEHTEERVIKAKDPVTGEFLYEGLKKTWQGFLGYAFWKTDLNFDVRNHVREYDYGGKLELRSPCTHKDLQSVLGGLYEAPWDRSRSPWELLLVEDITDEEGVRCSAMILRIDHTLADGFSILGFFKNLTHSPFTVPKFKQAERRLSFWGKIGLIFKVLWDFVACILEVRKSKQLKWSSFQRDEPMITCVSPIIPVHIMKNIKNQFGVNYAALVYASVLGAIDRAVKRTGQEAPERLSGGVALPQMGHPMKGLVVHASATLVNLTFKAKDPVERLKRIDKELEAISKSAAVLVAPVLSQVSSLFPMIFRSLATDIFVSQGLTVGITNFPVTTSQESYNGYEVQSMIVGVGTWAPLGMVVTIAGISNKQIWHVAVNPSVFTDPKAAQNLGLYIVEEIEALAQQVGFDKKGK